MDLTFAGEFTLQQIIFNLTLAFVLAYLVALVYMRTHSGISYSQSYVFNLLLMSLIVTVVMMVIGNSLARAFGLLGAFSIIRFRTAVKDSRDTGFIFFVLAEGMAVGTGNYLIAVASTVLVLLVILLLSHFDFGAMRKKGFLLTFLSSGEAERSGYEPLLSKYLKSFVLVSARSSGGGASEMNYHARFRDDAEQQEFLERLSGIKGITSVKLLRSKDDIEY